MRTFLKNSVLCGCLAFCFVGKAWSQEAPAATVVQASLQDGLQSLSSIQSMIELFFMEAGVYPPNLKELNVVFNTELPKGAQPVPVPQDPSTGGPFVYKVSADQKAYLVSFPDPSLYGLSSDFALRSVKWGWLALRAEQRRFTDMVKLSKFHIESLATQIEMFAKDNKGAFPKTLDELYPKYIERHPQDPVTGLNYSYQPSADGYTVGNPNPERYGFKVFHYSSSQGIQVELLPRQN